MTEKQRNCDLKIFSELVKTEVMKLGNYDCACSTISVINMGEMVKDLGAALYDANFSATWHHESVIEISARIAALALSVAASSRRALADYEALRA